MERINCYAALEGRGYGTEKDFDTGVRFSQSLKTPAFKNPPNRRYKKDADFSASLIYVYYNCSSITSLAFTRASAILEASFPPA